MRKSAPGSPRRKPAINAVGSRRVALLIGNAGIRGHKKKGYEVSVPGTHKDLAGLSAVLGDPGFGGFEVTCLQNPTLIEARREIARVARHLEPADTIVIYYSGASAVDAEKRLYMPVSDSNMDFLRATCLDSDYVLSVLRFCHSRSQILIVDGCNSGAFFNGNRGIPEGFCAMTSCGPDEACWGDDDGGFFTKLLIEGMQGAAADRDGDGIVTTDELFRYVAPRARAQKPPTTPQMWSWNLPEAIPLVRVRRRVFISYSRADSARADALAKRLEDAGYGVFVDREDIRAGTRWRQRIESAIDAADTVVFLMSKTSLASNEVYNEIKHATTVERAIVPVQLDGSLLSGWYAETIGALQHIDARSSGNGWWARLMAALNHPGTKVMPAASVSTRTAKVRKTRKRARRRTAGRVNQAIVVRLPQ